MVILNIHCTFSQSFVGFFCCCLFVFTKIQPQINVNHSHTRILKTHPHKIFYLHYVIFTSRICSIIHFVRLTFNFTCICFVFSNEKCKDEYPMDQIKLIHHFIAVVTHLRRLLLRRTSFCLCDNMCTPQSLLVVLRTETM